MFFQRTLPLRVMVIALIVGSCGGDKPTTPTTPTPAPPVVPATLTAPRHLTPADDAQTNTLQPELAIVNATSSQAGAKTYEFEVSSTGDFTAIVISADNVTEDAGCRWSDRLGGFASIARHDSVLVAGSRQTKCEHRTMVHTNALQVPHRGIQ